MMEQWIRLAPAVLGMGCVVACGGASLPEEQLTAAKTSVSAAEAVGAKDEPSASLHLKMAQDGIDSAESAIDEKEYEKAERSLIQARYDAELAVALTRKEETRRKAEEAAAKVEKLRKEQEGQS